MYVAYLHQKPTYVSNLEQENVEALTLDFGELLDPIINWDRLDYDCVPAYCLCGFVIKIPSNVANNVGKGKGTVAHSWECKGCNGENCIIVPNN